MAQQTIVAVEELLSDQVGAEARQAAEFGEDVERRPSHFEFGTDESRALYSLMLQGEKVVAPTLFYSELDNALRQYIKAGVLDPDEYAEPLRAAIGFVDEFYSDASLMAEAVAAAVQYDHPVHDMLYAVLARHTGATLFTLDKRLVKVGERMGVNCIQDVAI